MSNYKYKISILNILDAYISFVCTFELLLILIFHYKMYTMLTHIFFLK